MNSKLLFCTLFFASIGLCAQDKKWSVEANYPIIDEDGLNGVIDLGVKYRFVNLGVVQLGAGLNGSFFVDRQHFYFDDNLEFDNKWKRLLIQPTVFGEINLPGISRLKPSVGVGYSVLLDEYDRKIVDSGYNESDSWGAFNANLGLSYDLTNRFFVKIQYDYLNHRQKWLAEADYENNVYRYETRGKSLNVFKAGIGFRF
ncbi:MAG: hypothetical protein CMP77_15160 [Flavobacterium sp.]|nr:hypothetical protein [Pseudozobellia sp.]MBF01297.1 hypothetical protein [Flavobacterium sp.]MBG49099.1 hypothetical protein [Pseudozobellia sp.]|tara:strand:- start:11474 stop:12073 length:600 start_codon:yes stop_codon:yes gene_type:complete